jgi:hypothetical protein
MLKLSRSDGETSINLALKNPAAAAKADIMPKPGQARLMFGNLGNGEATITINKQVIKIAPGAGGPQSKGPTLELPPGKYPYSLKVAGGPARNETIELAADDARGLMGVPGGERIPRHVYSRPAGRRQKRPRRRFRGPKSPPESRFCRAFESAFAGLEKHPKSHIYSITWC